MAAAAVLDHPACKICGGSISPRFGLPRGKLTGHPIPDEPDDCWYYQCDACKFLFTSVLDEKDHTEIYDETYWNTQDPGWYGRVGESLRLVLLANELLKARVEQLEILDFGCGIGGFVEIGRQLQMNVWGTDIIPPKVAVEYFLPDVGDQKFDIVAACEVVEHLPFPAETFATIRSYLKSPGVFAFQTAQWDPDILDRNWWYLGPANGHISLFSREALDTMYARLGASDRRDWRGYPGVQAWLFE
jgi:SAM-dependent methyltransferase